MLIEILYPYVKFTLGTLYPSYKTWKALKRKDETIRRRWMKYWVSFGAFQMFELVADISLAFICPFYIELKLMAIMWLVLGTKLVFDSIVNRELTKREKTIDKYLGKVQKARDEIIALIWYEISRCSVKIVTAIMSGGLSVVLATKIPDTSLHTSPVCSSDDETDGTAVGNRRKVHYGPVTVVAAVADLSADDEEEDGDDDDTELMDHEEQQETVVHYREPDFNENMVSMEWMPTTTSKMVETDTTKGSNATITGSQPVTTKHAGGVGLRKSARREQMNLKLRTTRVTSIKEID